MDVLAYNFFTSAEQMTGPCSRSLRIRWFEAGNDAVEDGAMSSCRGQRGRPGRTRFANPLALQYAGMGCWVPWWDC